MFTASQTYSVLQLSLLSIFAFNKLSPFFAFDGHLLSCIALSSVGKTFEDTPLRSNDFYFEARLDGQPNKIFTGIFTVSSTVDLDVELNSSNSIHSYAVKTWSTMFSSEKKLSSFMHQVRHLKSSTFETKSLLGRNSHVGHSKLIHRSTQIRYVGLLGLVHEKLDV